MTDSTFDFRGLGQDLGVPVVVQKTLPVASRAPMLTPVPIIVDPVRPTLGRFRNLGDLSGIEISPQQQPSRSGVAPWGGRR